jgi:tRNA 2-selenouridine synthase
VQRPDTAEFRELFLHNLPLIDTRAPVEFQKGAFPGAVNLPLMNDEERHAVGIRYKEAGQEAAIALGEELIRGNLKERRIAAWCRFAGEHPQGYLYCFRGGLRSQTAQRWMRDAGVDYPLVLGGYKAMRRYLLEALESSVGAAALLLIAGKTGTGKTRVVEALQRAVDLERLAVHRGSSFGHLLEPQPSQIDFENALSIELLRLRENEAERVVVEDEGRLIGRIGLPQPLLAKMQVSDLLVLEEPLQERVEIILEDYVRDLGQRYQTTHGQGGEELHRQQLLEGLGRLRKRLGGAAHAELESQMRSAFDSGDEDQHRHWIESLLTDYYDPMYDYQMSRREGRVLARGSREEITAKARQLAGETP